MGQRGLSSTCFGENPSKKILIKNLFPSLEYLSVIRLFLLSLPSLVLRACYFPMTSNGQGKIFTSSAFKCTTIMVGDEDQKEDGKTDGRVRGSERERKEEEKVARKHCVRIIISREMKKSFAESGRALEICFYALCYL
jgi:hypothetical protein